MARRPEPETRHAGGLAPLNSNLPVGREKQKRKNRMDGIEYLDYKDSDNINRFINDQGKLLPRRITGVTAKQQRQVTLAVKRARQMALLPYVADNLQ
jgi:small subunit ribosomal protein S18